MTLFFSFFSLLLVSYILKYIAEYELNLEHRRDYSISAFFKFFVFFSKQFTEFKPALFMLTSAGAHTGATYCYYGERARSACICYFDWLRGTHKTKLIGLVRLSVKQSIVGHACAFAQLYLGSGHCEVSLRARARAGVHCGWAGERAGE